MENQYVQAAHAPALPADWTRSKADVEADLSGQIDAQERRNETLANEIQAEGQAQAKALRAMIEPMREQVMAERIKYTRDNFGQGINFRATGARDAGMDPDILKKEAALRIASHYIDKIENIGNVSEDGWKAFWQGIGHTDWADFASLGMQSMEDNFNIAGYAGKLSRGGTLTDEEEAALQMYKTFGDIAKGKELTWQYGAGQAVIESIPFMIEMALTGGVGAGVKKGALYGAKKLGATWAGRGVSRLVTKGLRNVANSPVGRSAIKIAESKAGKFVGNAAKAVGTAVADAAPQAAVMPATFKNYAAREVENYDIQTGADGKITARRYENAPGWAGTLFRGYLTTLNEIMGEKSGAVMAKPFEWVIKRYPNSSVVRVLGAVWGTGEASGRRASADAFNFIQGIIPEIGEEYVTDFGEILFIPDTPEAQKALAKENAWREMQGLPPRTWKDRFTVDDFLTKALSIGVSVGTINLARQGMYAIAVASERKALNLAGGKIAPELRVKIDAAFAIADPEKQKAAMQAAGIGNITSAEEQKAVFDYMTKKVAYDFMQSAEEASAAAKATMQADAAIKHIIHESGRYIEATDAEGNTYVVTKGAIDDPTGTLIVRDTQSGEAKQISTQGLQFMTADAEQVREELIDDFLSTEYGAETEQRRGRDGAETEQRQGRDGAETEQRQGRDGAETETGDKPVTGSNGTTQAPIRFTLAGRPAEITVPLFNDDGSINAEVLDEDGYVPVQTTDENGNPVVDGIDVEDAIKIIAQQQKAAAGTEGTDAPAAPPAAAVTAEQQQEAERQAFYAQLPKNKKGETDFDAMTPGQQLQYAEYEGGVEFALKAAANSKKATEASIAKLTKQLDSEANPAKAVALQKKLNAMQENMRLIEEYARVKTAPAQIEEEQELDDNGIPFVKASNGTTTFGELTNEQATAIGTNIAAPIKLSQGNAQYGEEHINHRITQLKQNGYENAGAFVEDVAANYDEIREGNIYIDENGNEQETFLLIKNGEKGSVLFVELAPNKGYYDVNSGGVFNNKYINKKKLLWSGGTHQTQPSGEVADVSIGQSKISPSESPGAPLSQSNSFSTGADKGTKKYGTVSASTLNNETEPEGMRIDTATPQNNSVISTDSKGTKKSGTVQGGNKNKSKNKSNEKGNNLAPHTESKVEGLTGERETLRNRIREWLSKENLQKATGKTRSEIFDEFGNELKPIAIINSQYLRYLSEDITDNHVYSGKGYLIDHAVNNHPNISIDEYDDIQDILDNPDDVKLDNEREKPSLIFIKKYGKYGVVIVNADISEDGKIVFHKTFFIQEKKPYASLPSIRSNPSLGDDTLLSGKHPPISPVSALTAAVSRFSGLNDGDKVTTNISTAQEKTKNKSNDVQGGTGKTQGKNGETQGDPEARGVPEWHNDTEAAARQRGFKRILGSLIHRNKPLQYKGGVKTARKFTDKGNGVLPVTRAIVELEGVEPSHFRQQENPKHFNQNAQPKRREDTDSDIRAQQYGANIDPELIVGNKSAYEGSPVTNALGEVIQGNNRVAALRYMYAPGNEASAARYKQYLIDHAADFGMSAEQVAAMKNPVAIDIADIDDTEMVRFGQYTVDDMESGGLKRIPVNNAFNAMNNKKMADGRSVFEHFVDLLLNYDSADDFTMSEVINANYKRAADFLRMQGIINDGVYQSLFSEGKPADTGKEDLLKLLQKELFSGASEKVEKAFNLLPARARIALLQTIARDRDSDAADRIRSEIQDSIEVFAQLIQQESWANAKGDDAVKRATLAGIHLREMDFSGNGEMMPTISEIFSNFAIELATRYKTQKQTQIKKLFNDLYDNLQGAVRPATLLDGEQVIEKKSLQEAIKTVFNIDYVPNTRQIQRTTLGERGNESGGRQRGGQGGLGSREQNPAGERPADGRGGTASPDSKPKEVEPPAGEAENPDVVESVGGGAAPLSEQADSPELTKAKAELAELQTQWQKTSDDIARLNRLPLFENGSQTKAGKNIVKALDKSRALLAKIGAKKREIEELEGIGTLRFQAEQAKDLEAVNAAWNKATKAGSVAGKTFNLGIPSAVVQATGVTKPYKLLGDLLEKKIKKHRYKLSDLKDLPKALANPIAVFDGAETDTRAILTELQIGDNNVLVSVEINKDGEIDFSFVSSIYDKGGKGVVWWINNNKGKFFNKEKALNYLHSPALIAGISNSKDNPVNSEIDTAKVQKEIEDAIEKVKNFRNPKLPGEKLQATDKKFTPISLEHAKALVSLLMEAGTAKEVVIDEVRMREFLEKALGEEGAARFMMLWHGTAAEFEKFKKEFMMSGEGSMYYGAGFYFTDKRSIAREYAKRTENPVEFSKRNSKLYDELPFEEKKLFVKLEDKINNKTKTLYDILNYLETRIVKSQTMKGEEDTEARALLQFVEKYKDRLIFLKSNLLKVKIHGDKTVDDLNFMRWDKKPTAEQRNQIIRALYRLKINKKGYEELELDNGVIDTYIQDISNPEYVGNIIYWNISGMFGSGELASKFLLDAGIDGIQYPSEYQRRGSHEDSFNYVVFDEDAIDITDKIRLMATRKGEVYGFVTKGGVVYLDPNKLNANTPIHEFGHLWNDAVKESNPVLWAKIKALVKETRYFKDLLNDPAYANLKDDDARADEAFVQAIGDEGARVFHDPNAPKSIKERFAGLLAEFWAWIGEKLGIRDLSAEQISKLTFEQAVKGALADMTSGKAITWKEVAEGFISRTDNARKKPAKQADYDFDVTGITEANAQEMQRIKAAAVANGTFMKAPNGKQSKLNERQWLQVRTKAFKQWFGDWELANKLQMIEDLAAIGIMPHNLTDEQLREAYESIGSVKNKLDNRKVRFVNETYGKLLGHKGIDAKKIIPQLKDIFNSSIPIYSETEQEREGHKPHNNFAGYHNYLGKVEIDGKEYYVRFTVQEVKAKPQTIKRGFVPNEMHSAFISDVEIYENSAIAPVPSGLLTRPRQPQSGISDTKLQQFFETAREASKNVSKVVDENGEPMVVYHGSNNQFTVFDTGKTGSVWGVDKNGFFFTSYDGRDFEHNGRYNYGAAAYGQNAVDKKGGQLEVYEVFLNIRNPKIIKDNSDGAGLLSLFEDLESSTEYRDGRYVATGKNKNVEDALREGKDGVLVIDTYDSPAEVMPVAFSPSQIKSATGNNGNFDSESDDIRFMFVGGQGIRTAAQSADEAVRQEAETRLDNLVRAREMEEKFGVTKKDWNSKTDKLDERKRIKLATGWERGADGKWRYETGDPSIIHIPRHPLTGKMQGTVRLGDLIAADSEVLKAYPALADMPVTLEPTLPGTASYNGEERSISINPYKAETLKGINSLLAHEVQHAVQHIEGFARGSNASNDAYMVEAGEVEARNVQRRMNMTPEERRASLAADTEDVAREDQEFIYEGLDAAEMATESDVKSGKVVTWKEVKEGFLKENGKRNLQQNNLQQNNNLQNQQQNNLQNQQKNSNFVKNFNNKNSNETGTETRMDNRQAMDNSALHSALGKLSQGEGVYQTLIAGNRRGSTETTESGIRAGWDKSRFLAQLELSARENGTWIDDITPLVSQKLKGGFENEPYISKDGKRVIKINNFAFLNDKDTQYEYPRDFAYFVDRLTAHNELFPDVAYKIIGFAENSTGEVGVVLEQPYVKDAELATQEEIDNYLTGIGFTKSDKLTSGLPNGWTNGEYEITDAKPENVLKGSNGILYFIDTDINPVYKRKLTGEPMFKTKTRSDKMNNPSVQTSVTTSVTSADKGTKNSGTAKTAKTPPAPPAAPAPPDTPDTPDTPISEDEQKILNKKGYNWFDKLARGTIYIKALQDKIKKLGGITDEATDEITQNTDIDGAMNLSFGRTTTKAQEFEKTEIKNLIETAKATIKAVGSTWKWSDNSPINPGKEIVPYDAFGLYLRAWDMVEAKRLGLPARGEKGFIAATGITAAEFIKQYEAKLTDEQIARVWDSVNAATSFGLREMLRTGRITQDEYDEYMQRERYVPQREWFERDVEDDLKDYLKRGTKRGNA